jgi:hypothetical protein
LRQVEIIAGTSGGTRNSIVIFGVKLTERAQYLAIEPSESATNDGFH